MKIWILFGKATMPSKICYKVITLGTSEWRIIEDGFPMGVFVGPVFVDGRLHYLTKDMHRKEIVVAFHVGTEKFEVIEIPKGVVGCQTYLIPYRDCLVFVDFYNLVVVDKGIVTVGVLEDQKWVVKEVELPQSWKHRGFIMRKLHATEISTLEILLTPKFTKKTPFNVFRYDMEKRNMKEVEIHGLPNNILTGQVDVDCPLEYGETILSLKKLNLL